MLIQRHPHQHLNDRRSQGVVDDLRSKINCAISLAERDDSFDSQGRYSRSYSSSNEQLLATFGYSESTRLKIDPSSQNVESFREQSKGGRRSFLFGDNQIQKKASLKQDGSDKVYSRTVREFSEDKCNSFSEQVRVAADGSSQYIRTEHLDGKLERFFRKNPSTRQLGAQLLGGALGASVGTLLAAQLGAPMPLMAGLGASVGACFSGGMAARKPSYQQTSGLEVATYLPAQLVQLGAGLGTVGALFIALATAGTMG